VRRRWVVALALTVTGCSQGGPYVCGACPAPGIFLRGLPEQIRHGVVTACRTGQDCQSFRWRPRKTDQVPMTLPSGAAWSDLDGTPLQITIRSAQARWTGTATIRYRASGSSPCDCGDLHADVNVAPVASPPG
jgi:hypothetical protein